jgi:hypothetical protein
VGLKISVKLPKKTYASHTSHDIHLSKQRSPSFKTTISISQSKVSLSPFFSSISIFLVISFSLCFLDFFFRSSFSLSFSSFFLNFFRSLLSQRFFFFFFQIAHIFFSLSQFLFSFSGFFCYSFQLGDSLVDYWCEC